MMSSFSAQGKKYPNLFLVGAPKCGTTSLFFWLSQRPDIYCGFRKEPHTLIGTPEAPNAFSMPYLDYWSMYESWTDEPYALDASTFYFSSGSAARNIRTSAENAKILIALRDPTAALYSFYHENFAHGHERCVSLRQALLQDDTAPDVSGLYRPRYRKTYRYHEHVSRYFEIFGEDRVKVVFFEDIVKTPKCVLSDICDWLGLGPQDVSIEFETKNVAKAPRSQLFGQLVLAPPKPLEWVATRFLSKKARNDIRMKLRNLNFKNRPNPSIEDDIQEELKTYFSSDIGRLSHLLGRDLSTWMQ